MPKKKKQEESRGSPEYMLTYGDMVTLLLTFFVMLLSMATLDVTKFRIVMSSFSGALGFLDSGRTISTAALMDMGMNIEDLSEKMPTFQRVVEAAAKTFERMIQRGDVKITEDERGLIIQITSSSTFGPGAADITAQMADILMSVSYLLNDIVPERSIRIEGHTDNTPISTPPYHSNWELSTTRAVNVLRFLTERGKVNPARMSAVGYAHTRPLAPNDTVDGREKNRRVEVVILRRADEK